MALWRSKPETPLDTGKTETGEARAAGGGTWTILGTNWMPGEVVNVICAGGTGSGKTFTVGRWAMYDVQVNRPQHLVIADLKGEELPALKRMAAVRDYYLYSFDENTPSTSSLNPIATPILADAFLTNLIINPHAKDPYWQQNALDLGLAVAGAINYSSLADLHDSIRSREKLDELAERDPEVRICWSEQDEKARESFRTQLRGLLAPLRHPHIRALFAPGAEEPTYGPGASTLTVMQPPLDVDTQDACRPLMRATSGHIYRRSIAGYDAGGPGTHWIMDEATVTVDMTRARNWITTGRGKGQRIMLLVQNLGQIDNIIGHDARRDLIGSCDLHIYGKTQDQESAEAIARASGQLYRHRAVRQDADRGKVTRRLNDWKGTTKTDIREVEETRIRPDQVTGLSTGEFIVMQGARSGVVIVTGSNIEDYESILAARNVYPPEHARQLGIAPQPEPELQPQRAPRPAPQPAPQTEPQADSVQEIMDELFPGISSETPQAQASRPREQPRRQPENSRLALRPCPNCAEEDQRPGADCENCGEIVR